MAPLDRTAFFIIIDDFHEIFLHYYSCFKEQVPELFQVQAKTNINRAIDDPVLDGNARKSTVRAPFL